MSNNLQITAGESAMALADQLIEQYGNAVSTFAVKVNAIDAQAPSLVAHAPLLTCVCLPLLGRFIVDLT
jgi:hypothetical protein